MISRVVIVSDEPGFVQGYSKALPLTKDDGTANIKEIINYFCNEDDALLWVIDWRKLPNRGEEVLNAIGSKCEGLKNIPVAVACYLNSPSDDEALSCWCTNYPRLVRLFFESAHTDDKLQKLIEETVKEEKDIRARNKDTSEAFRADDDSIDISDLLPAGNSRKFITLGVGVMRRFMYDLRNFIALMHRTSISNKSQQEVQKAVESLDKAFNKDKDATSSVKNICSANQEIFSSKSKNKPPHLLLLGETGSGKSLLSDLIFELLQIKGGKKVNLNTSGLSPNLLENQMFGCLRGSATDIGGRVGSVLSATNGMLFLDEIGDIPLELQARFLTFLDTMKVKPDGYEDEIGPIMTYVVAATNKDLEKEVEEGRFRADLFNRFHLKIKIPSMNDRREDMKELVKFCLQNPVINRTIANIADMADSYSITHMTGRLVKTLRDLDYSHGNYRRLEQILIETINNAARDYAPALDLCHFPDRFVTVSSNAAEKKSSRNLQHSTKTKFPVAHSVKFSDHQWAKIRSLLPKKLKSGPKVTDPRVTIEGILWKLSSGQGWKLIPKKYGSYSTCYRYYRSWLSDGTWKEISTILWPKDG